MFRDYVHFTVNGQSVRLKGASAFLPLSDVLRYELGQTGTKVVCAEGDCGACTVMHARLVKGQSEEIQFRSINSCIATAILLDGCHIVTVEGLQKSGELSEIQNSMVRNFGGQCGFCTPGFVMSITNLYEQNPASVTAQKAKNHLTGNLCRCTGYTPIVAAALNVDLDKHVPLKNHYGSLPASRALMEDLDRPIQISTDGREFFAPTTLAMAADYRFRQPHSRIFSGATDLGVQINKGKHPGDHLVSLHLLGELYQIKEENGMVVVGARVSLDRLQKYLEPRVPQFSEFLNIFASPQIKNMATLAGNLANGSPIADTTPFLLTADGEVDLFGSNGKRSVHLTKFFQGYKKLDMKDNEIITHVRFRLPDQKTTKVGLYKISQRRDLDIACVNSSFLVSTKDKKITSAKIAYGGVGPTAIRLQRVEAALIGQLISRTLIATAKKLIEMEIAPLSDVRGAEDYRTRVSVRLFEKYAKEQLQV